MFAFAAPRLRRRPSLTPMIDVVFLLLIFFMLAARFGMDAALPLDPGGLGSGSYEGPPRLVDIGPDTLRLNGREVAADTLADTLAPLMTGPDDIVVLRPRDGADLQRLIDVANVLRDAGLTRVTVVE
ncbi:ExbD/TolR family protein [Lutimaribacter saemankumensis]|uniref:Biopolymer transport protein ExbD n=1 Tax=Lutimaribacter saemankumensis TaxID=490829 RepID=A0A1G8M3D2_9RHOB|nr:biopolymer transporter ExbD [Lutimaribacter saemankumensis]SDI62459.1 biopolymer transport protein ExbD [Lutimaribacter saemankumensis]